MRAWPLLLACATLALPSRPAQAEDLAAAIKATYLYKFAPFIAWPPESFAAPDDPFVICVQADDAFAGLAERAAAGQRIGAHPMVVKRLARVERGSHCDLAFLAGSASQSVAQALSALDGAPVLTVTDAARGGARGVVNFVLDAGRVRFSIDAARAQANGLGISSKLLALAVGPAP